VTAEPLAYVWTAMALVALWAATRTVARARKRLALVSNGSPRGVLARGRLLTARLDAVAFGLFLAGGIWSIAQGGEGIALRELVRFSIVGGLLTQVAVRVIANRRDERLERMLAAQEDGP
jgi:hypothetical protein